MSTTLIAYTWFGEPFHVPTPLHVAVPLELENVETEPAWIAILAIAYYAGGYVAGRMSRFDGPRQGLGTWLIGLIVTVVVAVAGVVLGAKYNVLSQLNLSRIPVDEGTLTTGGLIALAAVVVVTLLAAMAGGKQGTHYHRKIDRTGI